MALLPICYDYLTYITGMVLNTNEHRYDNFSVAKILMIRQVRYGYPTKTDHYDSYRYQSAFYFTNSISPGHQVWSNQDSSGP